MAGSGKTARGGAGNKLPGWHQQVIENYSQVQGLVAMQVAPYSRVGSPSKCGACAP